MREARARTSGGPSPDSGGSGLASHTLRRSPRGGRAGPELTLLPGAGVIRRKGNGGCGGCAGSEPCDSCAAASSEYFLGGQVQRAEAPGAGVAGGGGAVSPALGQSIARGHAGASPLEPGLRSDMEASFQRPLDHVRVATGDSAGRAADGLSARAFTLGSTISFARGEYQPGTGEGRRLIAHELAHVVQQQGSGAGVQEKLTVGSTHDPSEHAADQAADAVMRGEPVSLGPAAPALRRQPRAGGTPQPSCSGTATGPRTAEVTCGDRRFEVTATPVRGRRAATRFGATPGIDGTNVWLTLRICRGGHEVTITPSVNLPRVLRDAVETMISGGDIRGVSVSASARINWRISGTADIFMSGGGSTDLGGRPGGGRVGLGVSSGPFAGSGEIFLGPDGRPIGGGGTFTWTPGARTPDVDCSEETVELQLTCRELTTTPGRPPRQPREEQHIPQDPLFFFFEYATPTICGAGATRQQTCTRDGTPPQSRIDELVAAGARVTGIEGFTSPEGPRPPGRRFMGNDELSRQRAEAAGAWLRANAPQLVSGTFAATGRSELFTADTPRGGELEGDALTAQAVPRFLANDPLRPTDPAEARRIAGLSRQQQRDTVYPLLRRAVVSLERFVPADLGDPGADPQTRRGDPAECSEAVSREARRVLRDR